MANYLMSTFLTQVDELVFERVTEASREITQDARYRQIIAAVNQYSKDAPNVITEEEDGDGGKYYVIVGTGALLASWSEGFSRVERIEYPAATIASDEAPNYLGPEDWDADYWDDVSGTQTRYIYFPNHTPASTETFRVRYTAPYLWTESSASTSVAQSGHGLSEDDYIYYDYGNSTWTEATNTNLATHRVATVTDVDNFTCNILQVNVPDADFTAICWKAACLLCRAISAKYSRIGESIANVDSGAHTTKATDFSARADKFCGMYSEHLGLTAGEDGTARDAPAGTFIQLNTQPGWRRGRRYLFHR